MTAGTSPVRLRAAKSTAEDLGDVSAFCARPGCNEEFRRAVQPGFPKKYCTEDCRRAAQREVRRLRARLKDLESTVLQQRRLLAAYGAVDDAEEPRGSTPDIHDALVRAEGVLAVLEAPHSGVASEFQRLYDAAAALTVTETQRGER